MSILSAEDFIVSRFSGSELQSLAPNLRLSLPSLVSGAYRGALKVHEYGMTVLKRRAEEDFGGHEYKEDSSPVTGLDHYVSGQAVKDLPGFLPGPVLTEENIQDFGVDSDSLRSGRWIVDPIDGTRGILRSQELPLEKSGWGLSAAYVVDDVAFVGIISVPRLEATYFAVRGCGSYRIGGRTDPAAPEPVVIPERSLKAKRAAVSSSFSPEEWEKTVQLYKANGFEEHNLVKVSSLVKFVFLLTGEVDAAGAWRGVSSWDLAGAAPVISEAGGVLFDLSSRKSITFPPGKELEKIKGYVAVGPGLDFKL